MTAGVPPPVSPVRPLWRRASHVLLSPFRNARRRPLRALGLFGLTLLVAAAMAAGGMYGYFLYHLRAAREAIARGHTAEADRHLQSCQWVRPKHPEVLLLTARVARRSGNLEEADRLLDAFWAEYGDQDAGVTERLMLRAARGEVEAAGPPLLARIQAGGPEAEPAREALVTGYVYRFRWLEAQRLLDEWLSQDPDSTAALLLRGKLREQRLLAEEALADYRRVIELDPDHDEARLRLATMLLRRFYGEEALGHLERLRARMPNSPDITYQWAVALGLQGRNAEARAALDECLRALPYHAGALAERGRYAALAGDDRAALEDFAQALQLDPGNAIIRNQYAQALTRSGRAAEAAEQQAAIEELKADMEEINRLISGSLQAAPNDPNNHYQIAVIALRSGLVSEGLRWLQSALQVGPDHLPTHRTLSVYYQTVGNPVLASRHRAIARNLEAKKQ